MYQTMLNAKGLAFSVLGLLFLVFNTAAGHGTAAAEVIRGTSWPGIRLGLTPAARQGTCRKTDKAFPSDDAGFSAYYRR